jgi:hypothetical protein
MEFHNNGLNTTVVYYAFSLLNTIIHYFLSNVNVSSLPPDQYQDHIQAKENQSDQHALENIFHLKSPKR